MADIRDIGGLMDRAGLALPVADSDRLTVNYPNVFKLMLDLRGMGEQNVGAPKNTSKASGIYELQRFTSSVLAELMVKFQPVLRLSP